MEACGSPRGDKGTLVVGGTSARGETVSRFQPRSPHATRSGCPATSPCKRWWAYGECGELRRRAQRGGLRSSA